MSIERSKVVIDGAVYRRVTTMTLRCGDPDTWHGRDNGVFLNYLPKRLLE